LLLLQELLLLLLQGLLFVRRTFVRVQELVVAFYLKLVGVHLLLKAHVPALLARVPLVQHRLLTSHYHLPSQLLRRGLLELGLLLGEVGLVGRHRLLVHLLLLLLLLLLEEDLGL